MRISDWSSGVCSSDLAKADARRVIALDRDRARVDDVAGEGARGGDTEPARADRKGAIDVAVLVDVGRGIGFADGDLAGRAVRDAARRSGARQNARRPVDIGEFDRAFVDDLVIAIDRDRRPGEGRLGRPRRGELDKVGKGWWRGRGEK